MVLEVYEVAEWLPALSTFMDRTKKSSPLNVEGRYEFVGKIANEDIRKKFIDKSVKNCFSPGEQNPFKYGESVK